MEELDMDYFWFFTSLALVISVIAFIKISSMTDTDSE